MTRSKVRVPVLRDLLKERKDLPVPPGAAIVRFDDSVQLCVCVCVWGGDDRDEQLCTILVEEDLLVVPRSMSRLRRYLDG